MQANIVQQVKKQTFGSVLNKNCLNELNMYYTVERNNAQLFDKVTFWDVKHLGKGINHEFQNIFRY